MIWSGLEPETVCLEGRCSIQLSYQTFFTNRKQQAAFGRQNYNLKLVLPSKIRIIRYFQVKKSQFCQRQVIWKQDCLYSYFTQHVPSRR